MAEIARAIVEMPYDTGLPEDKSVNVWHFTPGVVNAASGEQIRNALVAFYTWDVAVNAVKTYLSPILTGTARVRVYRLLDAKPRVPVWDSEFDLGLGGAATPEPEEIACCLSFRTANVSGIPAARRRGRLYLGPLNSDAIMLSGGVTRIDNDFQDVLRQAAGRMISLTAASGALWAIYSRVDDVARPVVSGWIDNALDVQRRRGVGATGRVEWDISDAP